MKPISTGTGTICKRNHGKSRQFQDLVQYTIWVLTLSIRHLCYSVYRKRFSPISGRYDQVQKWMMHLPSCLNIRKLKSPLKLVTWFVNQVRNFRCMAPMDHSCNGELIHRKLM